MIARSLSLSVALSMLGSGIALARQEPGAVTARTAALTAVFAPVGDVPGAVYSPSLVVRSAPDADAPIVTTFGEDAIGNTVRVTAVSGDFARVHGNGVDGWASLRGATPKTMAIVLDPKTGATIARVPLGFYQRSAAFSPDGSRVVMYGQTSYGDDPCFATELRTTDFVPTRTIRALHSTGEPADIHAIFYGGPDGALYAVVGRIPGESGPSRLSIVRVRDEAAPVEPPVFEATAREFAISPDGHVGFFVDPGAAVLVVDLRRFERRATIAARGAPALDLERGFAPTEDGAQLLLFGDVTRIRILDVASGRVTREIRTGWRRSGEDAWLEDVSAGRGARLLVPVGFDSDLPDGASWLDGGRVAAGPRGIAAVVDTGAARYGVDAGGTTLFTLGRGARRLRPRAIARPDRDPEMPVLRPIRLLATPDGSRLILVVADPDGTGC